MLGRTVASVVRDTVCVAVLLAVVASTATASDAALPEDNARSLYKFAQMNGIKIGLHLVRCGQSLLICDDIDTAALHFRDMADCEGRRPAIIEHFARTAPVQFVIGRCRFLLVRSVGDSHQPASG